MIGGTARAALFAAGLLLLGRAEAEAVSGPAKACAAMAGLRLADPGLSVTSAAEQPATPAGTLRLFPGAPPIAAEIPPYCRIDGVIDRRTGEGGRPYGLGFAIALPDRWNGRFLFQGGGGLNGTLRPPLGAQAAGDRPALARGFAVVSTDGGHTGAVFDNSFMQDQQAALDFAQAAIGRVTPLARQIVADYYARPAHHAYFDGCSTGGREGMLAAERYPGLFDGIVAGDPAMRTGHSNLGLAWAAAAFNRIAPRDAAGRPLAAQDFSPADKKLLSDAILAKCDAADGLKDGYVADPLACHFDPGTLACKGAKTEACLSAAQVGALREAFAGPKDSHGNQVYPAFLFDTGMAVDGPGTISFLPTANPSPLGPPDPALAIDVDRRLAQLAADPVQQLTDTANWTNLSGFIGHGGKLILYHGTSDPWFSPLDTLDYYQRLARDNGGADRLAQSSRLFLVPGMGHCQGGPATLDQFDLLGAVVGWVEEGKAPDAVPATGRAFPGRSRPLCAYPAHAQYKGAGDPQDAGSFACRS